MFPWLVIMFVQTFHRFARRVEVRVSSCRISGFRGLEAPALIFLLGKKGSFLLGNSAELGAQQRSDVDADRVGQLHQS